MSSKTILIVDDEEFIRLSLEQILSEEKYNVILNESGAAALKTIKGEEIDLVLLDLNLPDMSGIDILRQIRDIQPEILTIIMTGFASVESAVEAIKLGAYDYIKKPFKADAIKLITKLAIETQSLKKTVSELIEQKSQGKSIDSIIGNSTEVNNIKNQIIEFAKHDSATVLITGQSGTGKELVASALHNLSSRRDKEFVEINCASIPENLLESELFGYEKGAFTDAKLNKAGLLEKADGGTLFLDEIGEMSSLLQAKLLRVIENKKFMRLGSTKEITSDIKIIAATNKNLKDAIANKNFREDLYYRLNVLRIEMPTLRERGEDITLLANHFLGVFSKKFNKKITGFSDEAKSLLLRYDWPGNIRELKNIIERICILQKLPVVEGFHLPVELTSLDKKAVREEKFDDLTGFSFEEIIRETEIDLIKKAYELSGNNTSQTARLLKIPRETLRYKLEKYNISNGEI
ncbi:MAG TPA: sigma-54 dependent transcriptional regulator [Ignavibacteriaceae bacterium]|nr:sigma-54 dependent transcriptional regulator [Ignavibacteriaceae bacterium]